MNPRYIFRRSAGAVLGLYFLGAPACSLAGDELPVLTVCARFADTSADGRLYACGAKQGRIVFGQTSPGKPLRTFYICELKAIALSPDGRFLAAAGSVAGSPPYIRVWDADRGTLLCTLPARMTSRPLLKFSPDGRYLVSTCPNGIEVWNTLTGERTARHRAAGSIAHLKFQPEEERTLVTISEDGSSKTIALR